MTDAVFADLGLAERQKQVLLDIYQSFRRDNQCAAALTQPHPANTSTTGETTSSRSVAPPSQALLTQPHPER